MVFAGLDLSRKRVDVHVVDGAGATVLEAQAPPDADGLRGLTERLAPFGPVRAAIESMNGARFVHDRLEQLGWDVAITDAQKVKGLAPLACKTDRIDAWVLAELGRRDLVPAIWLPDPQVRAERERARWRLHLVRHRVQLKNRIHQTLIAFGAACPVGDLFGQAGGELLDRLELPDPWRSDVLAAVSLIDELDRQIAGCERELRRLGADHRYVALLQTAPGIGWVLGTRSPPRSATSPASLRRRSCAATPASVRASTNRAPRTSVDRWPRTARSSCAGADRSGHTRRAAPRLPRPPPAHRPAPGPPARQEDRPRRDRPKAHRGDLAHAHPQPALLSGRSHPPSGRLTALFSEMDHRTQPPTRPTPGPNLAIER
jgi:transposase